MPISNKIYNICNDVTTSKRPYTLTAIDLINQFDANERTTEVVSRISSWLSDHDVECIPPIDSVPLESEIVLIPKRGNRSEFADAKSKLQVRLLNLSNKKEKDIIYCLDTDSIGDTLVKLYQNKLENILVMEEYKEQTSVNKIIKRRAAGFINIQSYCELRIAGKDELTTRSREYICKKYKEINCSEPLISTIDEMIRNNIDYLVIKNDGGELVGACDIKTLLREYYPLSRPYLILSIIENSLVYILKKLKYDEETYIEVIKSSSTNYKVSTEQPPEPESLTLYQKSLLLSEKYLIKIQCTDQIKKILKDTKSKVIEVNLIRNKIAHFKPEELSNTESTLLEKLSEELSRILNLLKTTK